MSAEREIERLKLSHPNARYFDAVPIDHGDESSEEGGRQFYYVSLYEHSLTNAFRVLGGYPFVISNTFVGSHIYNIALICLRHQRCPEESLPWFRKALRHNFKKFFAECVLGESNCLLGRALLIETLAFEQGLMAEVFEEVKADPELDLLAREIASAMTSMLTDHEMAHYHFQDDENGLIEFVQELAGVGIADWMEKLRSDLGSQFAEEVECDLFSAIHLGFGNAESFQKLDTETRIRLSAFHSEVFSHFGSLSVSAQRTAERSRSQDLEISLGSDIRTKHQFQYTLGRYTDLDARRDLLTPILDQIAQAKGVTLYGNEGLFWFTPELIAELREAFESCLEEITPLDGGLTGTDIQRRGMAQLIAESLHGHDQGAEHLLWRSKQLSRNGQPLDP